MLLEFDNFAHQLSEFKSEEILWQVLESAEVVKLSNFFSVSQAFWGPQTMELRKIDVQISQPL